MQNILRALIYNKEVSLTLADTTAIVAEGMRLHGLSPLSARVYGKAVSALAFMSSALKEEEGEISLALQCDGGIRSFGFSGNRALRLRGYIDNTSLEGEANYEEERRAFGYNGALTVVRNDGYNRPFVGACGFPSEGGMDEIMEEYYRISEQLPTRIATVVELDDEGVLRFAGVAALQPLPFASEETIKRVEELDLQDLAEEIKGGLPRLAEKFDATSVELREATYTCNCSREYLAGVMVTLGEAQLRDIIATEGAARVHCHYCNSDYEFTLEDVEKLFPKKV